MQWEFDKTMGQWYPKEEATKTVSVHFYGSYEMEVPIDWDDNDIVMAADRFEVDKWEVDIF